jgi:hypothetical protein
MLLDRSNDRDPEITLVAPGFYVVIVFADRLPLFRTMCQRGYSR